MSCDANTVFLENAYEEGLEVGETEFNLTGEALETFAEDYANRRFYERD